MEIERFERLYQTIDVGDGGFITLLSLDGVVITRVPDPMRAKGRKFFNEDIAQAVRSGGRFDAWAASPVTGERVLVSAAAVRGFPLFVTAGATEGAVLAPWRDEAWLIGLRTLLTSAAVLALIALAAWGLARRERAMERSEKRFRAMIEHSADGMLLTRPKAGGILYVSPTFERLTGYRFDEVRGKQYIDLIHPEHQRALEAPARRDLAPARQGRHPGSAHTAQGRFLALGGEHHQQPAARARHPLRGHEPARHHRAQAPPRPSARASSSACGRRRRWRR